MTAFFIDVLVVVLCLAVGRVSALHYMLDSTNEHHTPRGRCIVYKIPGNSLVTGKVHGVPPANGRIGVYVRHGKWAW